MAEIGMATKALSLTPSLAKFMRGALNDRERRRDFAAFLTRSLQSVASDLDVHTQARFEDQWSEIAEAATRCAVEEANRVTRWWTSYRLLRRRIRPRFPLLAAQSSETMATKLRGWLLAVLPPGHYDREAVARRAGERFLASVGEVISEAKASDERRLFGVELIRGIEANDDVERRYGAKRISQRHALTAGSVGTGATALAAAADFATNHQVDSPLTLGVAGVSVAVAAWLASRAAKTPSWQEAAAIELSLQAARDWVEDVRIGRLVGPQVHDELHQVVLPRLMDSDLPVLVAALRNVADAAVLDPQRDPTGSRLSRALAVAEDLLAPADL